MKTWSLWFVVLLLLAGCFGGSTPETRYYLLNYVPEVDAAIKAKGPIPGALRVREFAIAEAYRRSQIVYRQSPHELMFYNYQQWAIKPERLVSDMAAQHFRAASLFSAVQSELGDNEADYVLDGTIDAIEEYDNGNRWYAHMALTLSLREGATGQVVWSQNYDYRAPVEIQEPVYVVRSLSSIFEGIMSRAIVAIDSTLDHRRRSAR